jgi:D-sedoheptulose 7-phosphate isomerase
MPKDNPDMTLGSRAAQFQALLAGSEFTGADGARLSLEDGIARAMQMLRAARDRASSVYLVGNGGSAGVASHATTDFVNVAKLRAQTVHDSSLLTCMANDYGYENAFARILSQLAGRDDVLVAISSSGKSANIRNAAATVKQKGGQVLTLSGFERDNPLRALGDLNVWLDSRDYGFVEIGHQFILHNIADRFGREQKAG